MENPQFLLDFKDNYDIVQKKTTTAASTLKGLKSFFQKWSDVESRYSKDLLQLSREGIFGSTIQSVLANEEKTTKDAIESLIQVIVRGYEGHSKLADDLEKITVKPLAAMKKQLTSHSKYWSERAASSIKDYKQVQSSYTRDQDKYESVKKEVKTTESKLFLNENDSSNWKIKKKLEESKSKIEFSKRLLDNARNILDEALIRYNKHFGDILLEVEQAEIRRIESLQELFAKIAIAADVCLSDQFKSVKNFEQKINDINPGEDVDVFLITNNLKAYIHPAIPTGPLVEEKKDVEAANEHIFKILKHVDWTSSNKTDIIQQIMPSLRPWLEDKIDSVKAMFKRLTSSERWEPIPNKGYTQQVADLLYCIKTLQEELDEIFKEEGKELWAPTFINFMKETFCKYIDIVEEILKVLPDFRPPAIPPIGNLLQGDKKLLMKKNNKLNSFRGIADQSPKGQIVKSLCVRLANLEFFFNEGINILGKVMVIEPSQIYSELKNRIEFSADKICDVLAQKIIYSDVYPLVFYQLYAAQDLSSRFPLICDLFNGLVSVFSQKFFQLFLKKCFIIFLDAWKNILLGMDIDAIYCEDISRVLRNDVNSTISFFELKQENGENIGLSREEQQPEITKVLEIMVYCPKSDKFLIDKFRDDIGVDDRAAIAWILFNRQKKESIELLLENKHLL